jgi:voltage-gated potassium channel Kch
LLIEPEAASLFGAVITLSMVTTPFLMILAGKLANERRDSRVALDDPELADRANIIIVGHGRFGQSVAQIMQAAGRSVTVIDIKPAQIDSSGEFGRKVFYGDGTRIDLLRRAGAEDACAIIFCIDDRELNAETLTPVRETFPDAKIYVRAFDRAQMIKLMPDKDLVIVREVFDASVRLARKALRDIGMDHESVDHIVNEFRHRDRARLIEQFSSGNMRAGQRHSFGIEESDEFLID